MRTYPLIVSIEDVLEQMSIHHSVYDKSKVREAYEFAANKHAGIKRGTGEDYIMHPLRVAKMIASWGGETQWVCAGLLHDVVEDVEDVTLEDIKNRFDSDIAEFVNGVTKIDKNKPPYNKLSKQERNDLTDIKLQSVADDVSLYIKFADRLDNLLTIEGLSEEKRIAKAINTRDIINPLARLVGAEKILSEMEELCFPIFHPDEALQIEKAYADYRSKKLYGFNNTIKSFKNALLSSSADNLHDHREYICNLIINRRALVSIYRQLTENVENIKTDFEKELRNGKTAWYDLTLIIRDTVKLDKKYANPSEVFFTIYEQTLLSQGVYIIKTCRTTRGDSRYILMCDKIGNLFRLFIRTENEYRHYEIGNIVDSYNNLFLPNINTSEPRESYNKPIKVFKRDGKECYIDAGATALDFAFKIHTEIGLHFDHAELNGSPAHLPAHHRLSEGDTVNIITTNEETVDLKWIKYLKTSDAMDKLYRYLSIERNLRRLMDRMRQNR